MPHAFFSPKATSCFGCRLTFVGVAALLVFGVGCGSNNQRLQQLQNENDRLLSEFRAQRDQVTQLNERLAAAQNRLAESEKLLARQSPAPSTRLSRLNHEFGSLPPSGVLPKDRISASPNSSAPATSPSASGAPTGESELYWRPMRRNVP